MVGVSKTGVKQIRLTNFRSYDAMNLVLDDALEPVILTGHNGAGKTNVLEAVSFLTAGKGLRGARLADVAKRTGDDLLVADGDVIKLPARWSVSAKVQTINGEVQIGTGTVDGSERRQIRIDGNPVSKQATLGEVFRCLWLTPAQDRLFCGDPASRRRFLDRLVQAFDPTHATRTSEYNTAFKQWSHLLREGRYDTTWLSALEKQMALSGVAIAASRLDIAQRISGYLQEPIAGLFPCPDISLTGIVEQALQNKPAVLVEQEFADILARSRKNYADGGSVSGPHTADFKVNHRQKNMDASLCSTGEQKALLISIILAQMKAQMNEQGLCPILLMDEVAAHLDVKRRNELFDILHALPAQVWMTGTDVASFSHLTGRAQFFDVEESILSKLVA